MTIESLIDNYIIQEPVITLTSLKAIDISSVVSGVVVAATTLRGVFIYDPLSSATPDNINVVQPNSGAGRWILSGMSPFGATMLGNLLLNGDASQPLQPVTYQQFLSSVNSVIPGYSTFTSSFNLALNNPGGGLFTASLVMDISMTNSGLFVTLQDMTGSPYALGEKFVIRNPAGNTNSFGLKDNGGTTLVSVLLPGQYAYLEITSKSTPAGTFRTPRITGALGGANGVASLDSNAFLSSSQFPALTGAVTTTAGSLITALSPTFTPVGKHNIAISLGSVFPALTNGVTITQVESTTNKNNYRGWNFINGVATFASFLYPMPKSWNGGSLTVRLFLVTSATTGNIGFKIQAINRNNGDAFDLAYPPATTIPTVTTAGAYDLLITSETTFTPSGNAFSFPSLVEFRIQRSSTDSAAASVMVIGVLISITTNAGNDA